jgi:hypothetical protein
MVRTTRVRLLRTRFAQSFCVYFIVVLRLPRRGAPMVRTGTCVLARLDVMCSLWPDCGCPAGGVQHPALAA